MSTEAGVSASSWSELLAQQERDISLRQQQQPQGQVVSGPRGRGRPITKELPSPSANNQPDSTFGQVGPSCTAVPTVGNVTATSASANAAVARAVLLNSGLLNPSSMASPAANVSTAPAAVVSHLSTLLASSSIQQPSVDVKLPSSSVNTGEDGSAKAAGVSETAPLSPNSLARADAVSVSKALNQKMGLIQQKANLELLQRNQEHSNNPLFSVRNFEELRLREELLRGIYSMNFKYPSKIQEHALPVLLQNPPKNMIAQSQSGTGKTAAFVLTMLSRADPAITRPQCICVAPTYELALQIGAVIEEMGKFMPQVKLHYAVRGRDKVPSGRILSEQIIVGTPGKLLDYCQKLKVIDMKDIKVFVLDEADVMIALQGHQDQSIRLKRMLPETCQILLFSATYTDEIVEFAERMVHDAYVIRVPKHHETLDNVKQYYVTCTDDASKFDIITNIYGMLTIGQSMIFCRLKKTANWLATRMSSLGLQVGLLNSDLTVEQRASVFFGLYSRFYWALLSECFALFLIKLVKSAVQAVTGNRTVPDR